jgi:hypothetical protein
MANHTRPLADRFWRFVQKSTNPTLCWLWIGRLDRDGYGRIGKGGKYGGMVRAPRAAWELTYGPIPNALCVCHRCDHPACVNPTHLFLGSRRDNTQDMLAKRRDRIRGERSLHAVLTPDQVHTIRHSPDIGSALAKRFHVSPSTICDIRRRRTWTHVA